MSLFDKPLVRVFPNGSWEVDAGKLLTSEKVRKDLEAIEELYQRLKEEGHDVRHIAGRHSKER